MSAFDTYAQEYDAHFTHSPIGQFQRSRVFRFLTPRLNKTKKVLEINCGTGEDAIHLAAYVNSVLATDISEGMISVANQKKHDRKIPNVEFRVQDIKTLPENLSSPFDLLFSDFGGLNCLSPAELSTFSTQIGSFIAPDGAMALVVMGKKCLWENMLFRRQKDPRYKRRNTRDGIPTIIHDKTFLTYYHAPAELRALFSEQFRVELLRPIGLCVPPSYLNDYFSTKNRVLKMLNALEKVFGNFSFLANYADHYLLILRKK